jgi:four helix bundle protein
MLTTYKELTVWQRSIELVSEIYALTEQFPKTELYGLTNQMRRAAVSIPSNIAEGYTRKHRQEYAQFVRVAFGSGAELETQLHIAKKLGFGTLKSFEKLEMALTEVMKMLNALSSSLVAKP